MSIGNIRHLQQLQIRRQRQRPSAGEQDEYSDDYDEDDEVDDYVPRQAAGGNLPANVVSALQQMQMVANLGVQQTAAVMTALLQQQQDYYLEEEARRIVEAQEHQHEWQSAEREDNHEYTREEHLNHTPTHSDDMGDDEDDDEAEEGEDEEVSEGESSPGDAGNREGAATEGDEGQLVDMSSEDYEPTEQEIHEYCEWLGMDVQADKCLMWIAREALKAPLPEHWKMCYTDDREIYYFNVRTGESIWDHPMDAYYKSLYKEEKSKLDKKRKRMRMFSTCLPIKPLSEFFSELSETCGLGTIDLPSDSDIDEGSRQGSSSNSPVPPPWHEVPESFVDPIDFRVFMDPIVLPTSGRTVSRHTIINNNWRDPFTREYCENRRLVPNVDKRSEVDRWLQKMVAAYVERMKGGRLSGLKRLVAIMPFLLDRDEEACVRGQGLVLGWIMKQIKDDTEHADNLKGYAEQMQQQPQLPPLLPSKGVATPRSDSTCNSSRLEKKDTNNNVKATAKNTAAPGGGLSSRNGSSNTNNGKPPSSQGSIPSVKKLQVALQTAREVHNSAAQSMPSASAPKPRQSLSELFSALSAEEIECLVLSLLTMSTSASREALLILVERVPALLDNPCFRKFDDEILFALRTSTRDLWEIAVAVNNKEIQEVNQKSSGGLLMPPPPPPQPQPSSGRPTDLMVSSLGAGGAPDSPLLAPLEPRDNEVSLEELLQCHKITDSERLLSLQWTARLANAIVPQQVSVHPVTQLDLVSATHIVLAIFASSDALKKPDPAVLVKLIMKCEGWPIKLASTSDKHIRALMELCIQAQSAPRQQIHALFDLTLHGSERCLDVMKRNTAMLKQNVLDLLAEDSQKQLDSERKATERALEAISRRRDGAEAIATEGVGNVDEASVTENTMMEFTPIDLMAAAMIFHEMGTLQEFASVCTPRIALKIGYNLTPRLARSQWRPKHFHNTVSKFVDLVETYPNDAWTVIDRVGLTFFLRELSKKKSGSNEIRTKVESLEYSEKQLEQSTHITRWALLSLKLIERRSLEVARIIEQQRAKKRNSKSQPQPLLNIVPTPAVSKKGGSTSPAKSKQPPKSAQKENGGVKLPDIHSAPPKVAPSGSLPVAPGHGSIVATSDSLVQPTSTDTTPVCSSGSLPHTLQGGNSSQGQQASANNVFCSTIPISIQLELITKKMDDLTRQRASLLSQALMLLITVRLKPKQQRNNSDANTGLGGSSKKSAQSPGSSKEGPVPQGRGQLTPKQLDFSSGAPNGIPPPPPLSLPSLRAPRGAAANSVMSEQGETTSTSFLPRI